MKSKKKEITIEINASPDSISNYLKKIWEYKSLIWVFAKRDLKVNTLKLL